MAVPLPPADRPLLAARRFNTRRRRPKVTIAMILACSLVAAGTISVSVDAATVSGARALAYDASLSPGRALFGVSDAAYGGDSSERLDVVEPAGAVAGKARPAVVLVHGGGWTGGSRTEMEPEAESVVSAGWVAVNVDYPLAPTTTITGQVAAVATAVAWVRTRAVALGVDPGRMALWGSSAGANLVLLESERDHSIAAVASWSGPIDLVDLAAAHPPRAGCGWNCGLATFLSTLAQEAIGCPPTACPAAWRQDSPDLETTPGAPPVLAVNSTNELVPVGGAEKLVAAWRATGSPAWLLLLHGTLHATEYRATATAPTMWFLATAWARDRSARA